MFTLYYIGLCDATKADANSKCLQNGVTFDVIEDAFLPQ